MRSSGRGRDFQPRAIARRRRPRAFTLIELLVVVGILTVLVALLMPAFAKARRQARTVTCLSNLRQLHLAFSVYGRHNRGNSFVYDPKSPTTWLSVLRPASLDLASYRLCPEAEESSYSWGTATSAWGPYSASRSPSAGMSFLGDDTSSYGFNGWMHDGSSDPGAPYHSLFDDNADGIPVFADANWVEGWPGTYDAVPADLSRGASDTDSGLGRFCLSRHGQSVNSVFLDGHAEQIPLESLWLLRWSRTFTPRTVTLPQK